jgi:hypothetical protein
VSFTKIYTRCSVVNEILECPKNFLSRPQDIKVSAASTPQTQANIKRKLVLIKTKNIFIALIFNRKDIEIIDSSRAICQKDRTIAH